MKMLIMRGKAGKYALPGEQAKDWPRGALTNPRRKNLIAIIGPQPR
jgi:hypothetical protein